MKKLSHKKAQALVNAMSEASVGGPKTFDPFYADNGLSGRAWVEFPLGELTNRNIAGFVGVWASKGLIKDYPIDKTDRFNAQGLEGKIRIATTLATALLVYRELPPNRCQLLV